ncbi:aldo/keto reductase [Mesosutterella sp. AGMB02718]|uniref:Aldo/keto reductase n=1 Tax=Mesosutterella faecium TaxID=2925194 RepID=A0ABT7IN15_9BURK|nr:aldo/keto reductase [Mesosutterella sp. AGMB02718]MDL2059773.1 aldo/keto reductase [Mesosutterella sp. AGMB02718]
MKYTELGSTGITVSRICAGCMSYGAPNPGFHLWTLDQDQTEAMVKCALDLGVNFFDTANIYSFGTSEEFLGRSLKHLGVNRHDVVLASKVYFNPGFLSKEAIHREIDLTLRRLGTDYLDLYQIHRFDYLHPIEETMEALDSLVREGKVRAIGASAMYGYQFHNMQACAELHGWTKFSTLQNHYNLLYREDERELIPVAEQYGVSRIPYSPLAGGHLTHPGWESGSKRSKTDRTLRAKYDRARENDLQIIARVEETARRLGVSMTQTALAWQFARGVAAPIVGATSPVHFRDAVKSVDLTLSEEDVKFLEEPYLAHELVGAFTREQQLQEAKRYGIN